MTMLSPAATYHAELRQQLETVGRAISLQRGLTWLARGLAAGTIIVLGLIVWAWTHDAVSGLSIPLLVAIPVFAAIAVAIGSLFIRHNSPELARRIDRAAGLQERSTTALELGRRGEEFPLALAQMRDAVEHLRRVDMLDAFPPRLPRKELLAAFFVGVIAAIVALSPNPWLLQARASNPSITIAREQAERVQRVADSLPQNESPDIDALRQLVSQGAQTMQARSNEPDAALNALQDLEEQVQQMSAGDDQLAAALAAVASALSGNQNTQALSDAINTGDMRQVSQAASDLAKSMANLSPQDRQQLAQVLRDAASKAGSESQGVASNLSAAADALQASAAAAGDPSQANQANGQQADASGAQGAQSAQAAQAASDAMNQLSQSAAAADARQRTASQLESSRNALERALGRTQSRSGNNNTSGSSANRSSSSSQASNGDQSGSQSQDSTGQSQSGDQPSGGGDQNGAGQQGDQSGTGNDTGTGGGYSTGGDPQSLNNNGSPSQLDAVTDPQQDQSGGAAPDVSSTNPYTSDAGSGSAQTAPESVQPSYSNKPTQGNDSGSIPLGLRDLVKDYFSSLDQK
ncbi:MAG: hypothetical protein JO352_37600 [Chloroflexi bacterium]|nr:hypothetical protein [Chloroflexota bacterium]MBV9595859.1 hypothetical protein [Chloroflexota bacterium]